MSVAELINAQYDCIKRIKSGETELMPSLWYMCYAYTKKVCSRYIFREEGNHMYELNDLINCSYIALVTAVERWEPTEEAIDINVKTFMAYYRRCISNETSKIRCRYYAHDPNLHAKSLNLPIDYDTEDEQIILLPDESAEEDFKGKIHSLYIAELKKALAEYDSYLDPLEKTVIHMRYYEGKSTFEIAKAINRNSCYVNSLEHTAFFKYRTSYHGIDLRRFLLV